MNWKTCPNADITATGNPHLLAATSTKDSPAVFCILNVEVGVRTLIKPSVTSIVTAFYAQPPSNVLGILFYVEPRGWSYADADFAVSTNNKVWIMCIVCDCTIDC